MTHITNQRALNQHLLSYLKLRWANAHLQATANPRNDFLAWLGPNGHTIDGPTSATLNAYAFLTMTTTGASVRQFSATNLAVEGETVASYVTRYQFAMLNATAGGAILDDAAHQTLLTQLALVQSNAVTTAWNLWHPTDPANLGRTFPQQLAAFKLHLIGNGSVLTGQSVITLATRWGFNYTTFVDNQLASVRNGHPGSAIFLPKVHEEAACWNWALAGCTPPTITPDQIITWLHSPLGTPEPGPLAGVMQPNLLNARNVILTARTAMHSNGLASMSPTFDQNWATNTTKVNLVHQINSLIFPALVELYGFTVQAPTQPLAGRYVSIEYRNSDGVSWEHWWVEDKGVIVETFPTMRFTLQLTNQTQVQSMGLAQQAQYTVIRVPVQALLQRQIDTVKEGLAQYL